MNSRIALNHKNADDLYSARPRRLRLRHHLDATEDALQHIVSQTARLVRARRESFQSFPTGASLRVRFAHISEEYSKTTPKYADFKAELIAEPFEGAPVIPMMSLLPPCVARRYEDFSLMLKGPARLREEQIDVRDLNRRYHKTLGDRASG